MLPKTSWLGVARCLVTQPRTFFAEKPLNFITLHYSYIICMCIFVSVVLYAIGGMHYVDALFFASGACTQSGLNTIDINLIHTGQQFMLYIASMLCNSIALHTFVVFVRLYWFEKKFKDVVKGTRTLVRKKSRGSNFDAFRRLEAPQSQMEATPYLSYKPTIGRNSFFVNLTREQREELGGIEYRALKTLAIILVAYFFAFHVLGAVCLIPWIYGSSYGQIITSQGQGRAWWGIFTAASTFNEVGFTLTYDSMIPFGNAIFPMSLMTFLIAIGNTGFPCALRFTIWCASKCMPVGSTVREELQFLLDHPRRCFTLLFPRAASWWLFGIVMLLSAVDVSLFVLLNLDAPIVTAMSPGIRLVDGLFQALSTRTAGFSVVNLAELHPAMQVSYMIMMYISVLPVAISMRRTNVYEERSLGIYALKEKQDVDGKEPSYIGAHLRKQLSFDLWYLLLGMFIIAIVEGTRLEDSNQSAFTLFSVLFETMSAYCTVGLSLGYPNTNASFSAEFATLSKLVIVALQIRGRHRGLPYKIDRAILLTSESLQQNEQAEAQSILNRGQSFVMSSRISHKAVSAETPSTDSRPETGLREDGVERFPRS